MSPETIEKVIDFIKSYALGERLSAISVTWYGGEPLLELDTIRTISKSLIDFSQEHKISYYAKIVTNGVLLTPETARLLKDECAVEGAQVTIDGLPEIHNKRRILKDRSDSFSLITKNIDAIKDFFDVTIRVNVDKNNRNEAEKLIDFFVQQMKWDDRVYYYFVPVDSGADNCTIQSSGCYTTQEFGKIHADLMRKIYEQGNTQVIHKMYPQSRQYYCGAITVNNFVIDPEGYLYNCWNEVAVVDKNIGSVQEGVKLNPTHMALLGIECPRDCQRCNLLPICLSGCPYYRLRNGNQPVCTHDTYSYKEHLKITYEEYRKERESGATPTSCHSCGDSCSAQ
jgi:uncharacterized protein